jgi:uridine kinase
MPLTQCSIASEQLVLACRRPPRRILLDVDRAAMLDRLSEMILAVERRHPVRVGIDGHSAAGKTTLADELAAVVPRRGRPVIRASVDDFHRPAAERYRQGRTSARGYYEDSFDFAALRAVLLEPLGPAGSRRYQTAIFDSWLELPIQDAEREAPADAILIVDGIFLFRGDLDDVWDFRIFLHIEEEEVMRRGPSRDAEWMGSLETAVERYQRRYLPGERLYFDEVNPHARADIVIDNTNPHQPTFIRPSM